MNFDVTSLFNHRDSYPSDQELKDLQYSLGIGWDRPGYGVTAVRKFLKRYPQHLNELLIKDDISGISTSTILMEATLCQRDDLVDELLAMKADPNVRDGYYKSTALMFAKSVRVARALLNAHARLDAQNTEGDTTLMKKLRYEHWDVAEFLINAGADPDIENKKHETARSLTKMSKHAAWELEQLQNTAAGLEKMSNALRDKAAATDLSKLQPH